MSFTERFGVKIIDPNSYHFEPGDHVSVLNTKFPENKCVFIQKMLKKLGLSDHHAYFFHHGIFCEYIDNIPYFISQTNTGIVKESVKTFSSGRLKKWHLIQHDFKKFSREQVVTECEAYLNKEKDFGEYNLFTNNCEHFAYKVINGKGKSFQIRIVASVVAFSIALITSAIGKAVKSPKTKGKGNDKT